MSSKETMSIQNDPGPLAQLRSATRSSLALTLGAALGGLVPCLTYVVAHVGELVHVEGGTVTAAPWTHPAWLLVAGGLLFSAKTVYAWTAAAFGDRLKALGFVALVEGVLLLSPSPAVAYVALAYLIVINALGTGARLALRDRVDRAGLEVIPATAPEVTAAAEAVPAPAPAVTPWVKPSMHDPIHALASESIELPTELPPPVGASTLALDYRKDLPILGAVPAPAPAVTPWVEPSRRDPIHVPAAESADLPRIQPRASRTELPPPVGAFEAARGVPATKPSTDPGCAQPVELDARLVERAVEVARDVEALSAAALRRALHVRHDVAATLIARLVAEGVLAETKNALGQRPVLLAG